MAQTVVRQSIVGNPGRKRKRNMARKKRSRNPGEILGFVFSPAAGNPGRKRGNMAKARKNRGYAKKNRSRARHHKRNPGTRKHHHYTHRARSRKRNPGRMRMNRRRRNPGEMGGIGPMLTNAVFVIVGALGSKLGAQAVLGTNNVGIVGYAGNAATGGVLWFLAEKVMKNRSAANGIIAGTLVQILLRVINDYTPFGSYVANLGMGDYQMQSFVTPQILVDPWKNADISIPTGWGAVMPAAPPMSASAGTRQMRGSAAPAAAVVASTAPATGMGSSNTYGRGGRNVNYGG